MMRPSFLIEGNPVIIFWRAAVPVDKDKVIIINNNLNWKKRKNTKNFILRTTFNKYIFIFIFMFYTKNSVIF